MYMISNTEHYSGKNEASEGNQKHCKKNLSAEGEVEECRFVPAYWQALNDSLQPSIIFSIMPWYHAELSR